MKYWKDNTFITLTYADDALVYGSTERAILVPRDLNLFWKRLRKRYPPFKYFACGEYGERSGRPHYHALIFGVDFKDKVLDSSKNGNNYYRSNTLDCIWGNGNCIIGDASFESASYVARYVMKKRLGKTAHTYEKDGITPEFLVMSRGNSKTGPNGIGYRFYDEYEKDMFPRDKIFDRNHVSTPPRYFTNRYKASHPLEAETMIMERVLKAKEREEENDWHRLKVRERIMASAIKGLRRGM